MSQLWLFCAFIWRNNVFSCDAVNIPGKKRDFGGVDHGDDQAALLKPGRKSLTQIIQDDSFREFEFRQYLFACQAKVCKTGSILCLLVYKINYFIQWVQTT